MIRLVLKGYIIVGSVYMKDKRSSGKSGRPSSTSFSFPFHQSDAGPPPLCPRFPKVPLKAAGSVPAL